MAERETRVFCILPPPFFSSSRRWRALGKFCAVFWKGPDEKGISVGSGKEEYNLFINRDGKQWEASEGWKGRKGEEVHMKGRQEKREKEGRKKKRGLARRNK